MFALQWTLAVLTTISLGVIGWMNSRVGYIQKELSSVSERLARVEVTTANNSKQLDQLQAQRFADAARVIEVAAIELKKSSSAAIQAAY